MVAHIARESGQNNENFFHQICVTPSELAYTFLKMVEIMELPTYIKQLPKASHCTV